MASFKRRGIVDFVDSQSSTALRAAISLSFESVTDTAAASLKLSLEAPVFLLNDEAKASLTRAQRVQLTFASTRRIRLAIALHIQARSITSITFSRQSALPDRLVPLYHRLAGHPVLALQLTLTTPPALVIPDIPGPLHPSTHTDLDILKAFQSIAGASSTTSGLTLTIYVPGLSLTDAQALSLCASVPGAFEALPEQQSLDLQLNELFGGLGARRVPMDEVATFIDPASPTGSPSSHSDVNSLPGYDTSEPLAGNAPPSYSPEKKEAAAAEVTQGQKRQRLDSPEITRLAGAEDHKPSSVSHCLEHQITAAHRAIARLEALHSNALEREAALDEAFTKADAKLAELAESSTLDYAETSRQEMYSYVDDRMDEMREELIQLLDDRLEVFGLDAVERSEVEELVEAQVGAAVEDLKERLAGGGVRVLFSE